MNVLTPAQLAFALQEPRRLTDMTPWQGHIPFAFLVVRLMSPRRIVELGTAKGDSYCAFCQAVDVLGLETACVAVDTWHGDRHSGELSMEVLDELRRYHDPLYSRFSHLLQCTFDEALDQFDDGSIDLLHIDGYHIHEQVRHDFESWLPKLSKRSVVLLHDVAVRDEDFGVWQLWDELKDEYVSYAFPHSYGLGVLVVGQCASQGVIDLIEAMRSDDDVTPALLAGLGERLVTQGQLAREITARSALELQLRELMDSRTFRWSRPARAVCARVVSRRSRPRS